MKMNYEASDFFFYHFESLFNYPPLFSLKFFLFLIFFQLIIYITDITDNLVPQRDFLTPAIIAKSSNFFIAPFNINFFKM